MEKIVRVKVIKEYSNLKEILPIGFETELIISLSDSDEVIPAKQTYITNKNGYIVAKGGIIHEQTIPAGNYQGYKFKSSNNEIYKDSTIRNAIGYIPMNKIFEKI